MRRNLGIAAVAAAALISFGNMAAQARSEVAIAVPVAATTPATIDVRLMQGVDQIWTVSLRLAAPHGSATYSQSKSEFAGVCAGDGTTRNVNSNENLRLYVNRRNYSQEPNKFSVNVNWVRPVAPCDGGGSDTIGFERPVVLAPGGSATVSGTGGLVVTLSRRP